jgi:hypothetical protein
MQPATRDASSGRETPLRSRQLDEVFLPAHLDAFSLHLRLGADVMHQHSMPGTGSLYAVCRSDCRACALLKQERPA